MEDHRGVGVSYVVTAPLVLAVDQDGHTHHVYKGGVIEWLSDEQAQHFLAEGLVVDSNKGSDDDSDDDGKPAKVATKAVLVDWLMAHGEYDRAELEDQTKDELWALIEATD